MKRSGMVERARRRKKRLIAHVAHSHADAERWDLEFWQRHSPQQRLSALAAIHRDIEAVHPGSPAPRIRWRP